MLEKNSKTRIISSLYFSFKIWAITTTIILEKIKEKSLYLDCKVRERQVIKIFHEALVNYIVS